MARYPRHGGNVDCVDQIRTNFSLATFIENACPAGTTLGSNTSIAIFLDEDARTAALLVYKNHLLTHVKAANKFALDKTKKHFSTIKTSEVRTLGEDNTLWIYSIQKI